MNVEELLEKIKEALQDRNEIMLKRPVTILSQDEEEDEMGYKESIIYRKIIDIHFNNKNELVIEVDR